MKNIKTKRLVLTPLIDSEMEELCRSESDEHLKSAYGEMAEGARSHPEKRLFFAYWEIALKKSGERIGGLCFKGPPHNGEIEIGIGIDKSFRRQGYAFEAAKAAVEWAFGQEGLYFVTAEAEADNKASLALLKKLEFTPCCGGSEGLRYEKEKPASSWMSIYMCLGISCGVSFGVAMDKLALCMPLGIAIGLCIGLALDAEDKKKRAKVKEERNTKTDGE